MRLVESDHFDGIKTFFPATPTRIDHPEQPVFFPGLWSYFFVSHPKSEWRRLEYKCSPNWPRSWLCGFTQSWNKSQDVGKSSTNISSWWKCEIKPCLKQLFQVYFPVLPGLQIRYHHSHHSHHFPLHKTTSQHQNLGFLQRSCTGHGHVHSILRRLGAKRRVPTNTWGNFRHWFCKKLLKTNGKTQKLSSWPVNRLEMLKWRNQSLIYWFRILKKNLLQCTLIFPKGAFSPKKTSQKELE